MRSPGLAPPHVPNTIKKLIHHVVGGDDEFFEWFINWLAYIFQNRGKTGTAPVLHGTQGTGKGQLYHRILKPLMGENHCMEVVTTRFDDKFNSDFERNLICFVDETAVEDTTSAQRTMNMLKHQITEPTVQIRAMRQNAFAAASYSNFIFGSNMARPIEILTEDRRFCVAPRQEIPLQITDAELDLIKMELQLFAGYLAEYPVSETKARTILKNEAREIMIADSYSSVDLFFNAIHACDLDYFAQYLQQGTPITPNNSYITYKKALVIWAEHANTKHFVLNEHLKACYEYLQNISMSAAKFTKMCSHHHVAFLRRQANTGDSSRVLGRDMTWIATDEVIDAIRNN
jgi:hypothetical protein